MIDYKSLNKACKVLGLNPSIRGDNPFSNRVPVNVFKDSFDLGSIKFPKKEMKQVLMIGQTISNLRSQLPLTNFFNSSKHGRKSLFKKEATEEILPVLNASMDFWFQLGLSKCKSKRNLVISDGEIYEIDPFKEKQAIKMSEMIEEVHRDFIRKSNASEIGTADIVLD